MQTHEVAAPEQLRVELLGGLRVTVGARLVPESAWRLRKARSLVALLALAPGHRLHREQLMDRLWPELDPDAAANQLRKALHVARRTLDPVQGARFIRSSGERLCLSDDVWCDLDAFAARADLAHRSHEPAVYADALEVYGGDLLPEDPYDDWAMPRREELRADYQSLLVELAELLAARGDLDQAVATLQHVVSAEPTHEPAHRTIMSLLALGGRRHDALQQYERLRAALLDIGVEPDVTTQHLYEQIRAGAGPGDPGAHAELWAGLGDLRMRSGDAVGAAAAYRSALSASGEDTPALHRKVAQALLMAHDTSGAERHLVRAEQLLTDQDPERARLLSVRANTSAERGDYDDARSKAEESVELARRVGTTDDLAAAEEVLAIVSHFRGSWREGLHAEIERLGSGADAEPQLARVFDIHHCIGQYHLYGDLLFQGVDAYARSTLELATQVGARRAEAFAWCLLGESLLLRGSWDEAAGCLQRSADIHAEFGGRSGGLPWQRLAELSVCRGDLDAAEPHLRRGMSIAAVSPMARHLWGRLYATEALRALEGGDPDGAVRAVRASAVAAARYGDCPSCSALLSPLAAEAFAALDDAPNAEAHAARAETITGQWDSSAWSAMARIARGYAAAARGDVPAATAALLDAAYLYTRAGQPFWSARCTLGAGLLGGPAIQVPIAGAVQTLAELGAYRLEARGREALAPRTRPQ